MSDKGEKLVTVLTLGVIVATLVLLLIPTGPLGSRVMAWRGARQARQEVTRAWESLDSIAQRTYGGSGALRLIECGDYECPYCRASEPSVADWATKHPSWGIGLVHFPLAIHPAAEGAARSALCADAARKGPEMHQLLIATGDWRADTNWREMAASVGITDLDAFVSCRRSAEIDERLRKGVQIARQLGVTGTPTFLSPEGRAIGEQTVERLEALQ